MRTSEKAGGQEALLFLYQTPLVAQSSALTESLEQAIFLLFYSLHRTSTPRPGFHFHIRNRTSTSITVARKPQNTSMSTHACAEWILALTVPYLFDTVKQDGELMLILTAAHSHFTHAQAREEQTRFVLLTSAYICVVGTLTPLCSCLCLCRSENQA